MSFYHLSYSQSEILSLIPKIPNHKWRRWFYSALSLVALKSMATGSGKVWGAKLSPKVQRKRVKSKVALLKVEETDFWHLKKTCLASDIVLQVYPNELESQPEFEGFSEWLQTFDLYRGKKSEEEFEDENRVVGKFKVDFYISIPTVYLHNF